jgi:hypothetical protein
MEFFALNANMDKKDKAVTYVRDPKTRGQSAPYEQKFASLIKLCEKATADGIENVIVNWPWVIGDTYEELIESLSRFADAGLALHVVERRDFDEATLSKLRRN